MLKEAKGHAGIWPSANKYKLCYNTYPYNRINKVWFLERLHVLFSS